MMGYQLVDIYDNVVEDHVAELIHTQIKGCAWKFDYHSNKQKPNKTRPQEDRKIATPSSSIINMDDRQGKKIHKTDL